MLKGKAAIRMDKSGRIKIPARFLKRIQKEYGNEVFVTSQDLKTVVIYPLEVWLGMVSIDEERTKDALARSFMLRVNRLGMKTEIDKKGRIMIFKKLRDRTGLAGDTIIEERKDHLVLMAEND